MGLLYTATSVSSYNANPPPDDGSTVATNLITWAGIKSKLTDPLNTFDSTIDANVTAAFGKTLDGSNTVSTGTNYPLNAADQGRLIVATTPGITITTPDATSVGSPFLFAINNQSGGGVTLDGFGTQTVDGQPAQSIPNGTGAIIKAGGGNWYTAGLLNAATGIIPQGYLTLASDPLGVVPVADITSSTNVYYSPICGNTVPIFNGVAFISFQFAQLTLALSASHVASTLYDVFIFLNPSGGAVTVGTGPAWSNSAASTSARGSGAGTTQIQRTSGLWTNAVSMTARNGATTYTIAANQGTYVGTIWIDGTNGQISSYVTFGLSRKWGTWNAYNRRPILLQAGAAGTTYSYNSAPTRAAHNLTTYSLTTLCGLPEEQMLLRYQNRASVATAVATPSLGIGWNVVNAFSGTQGISQIAVGTGQILTGEYNPPPNIGINTVTACESGDGGSGVVTWNDNQNNFNLTGRWNG